MEIAGSFSHRVRLEYYDCRLSRTTRSLAVEVLIQDLEDVIGAMATGAAYVNVHTTFRPGGEIRGQVAVD